MDALPELKPKLLQLVGSLLCRCIDEARRIPYILEQEEVMDMLIKNPSLFEKLVFQEHISKAEYAKDKLTAQLDAFRELGQLESLDAMSTAFCPDAAALPELEPVLDKVTELSRTFTVYTSNALTIFEKEFELFMDRFRDSLQSAGMEMPVLELSKMDMGRLEASAARYMDQGLFMQAFLFDRLLSSPVITRQLAILPESDYSLSRNLIRRGLRTQGLQEPLVKFILRASYVSQGGWHDLFSSLLACVRGDPECCPRTVITGLIEQDIVFSCNLLCRPVSDLAQWSPQQRSAAVDECLNLPGAAPEATKLASRDRQD